MSNKLIKIWIEVVNLFIERLKEETSSIEFEFRKGLDALKLLLYGAISFIDKKLLILMRLCISNGMTCRELSEELHISDSATYKTLQKIIDRSGFIIANESTIADSMVIYYDFNRNLSLASFNGLLRRLKYGSKAPQNADNNHEKDMPKKYNAEKIRARKQSYTSRIKSVLDYIARRPYSRATSADITSGLHIAERTARVYLNALVADGLLLRQGKTKGSVYEVK